jgi:alpha-ribazole phosphatase
LLIYLIRHGQTEWNQAFRYQGSKDEELNDVGTEQSEAIADLLKECNIGKVFSSPLKRAIKTATPLSKKLNINTEIINEFREINLGQWEGKTWEEIKSEYKDFLDIWSKDIAATAPPEGESYIELKERVFKALSSLLEDCNCDIALVSHGAVIKVILCTILQIPLQNRAALDIPNGSISIVDYIPSKQSFRVLAVNSNLSCIK